jgi:hypothetical protein
MRINKAETNREGDKTHSHIIEISLCQVMNRHSSAEKEEVASKLQRERVKGNP